MELEIITRRIGYWILRQRTPLIDGPHKIFLMLHGWTGDEHSMWVFARRLPHNALVISPRGLYPSSLGGYSWHDHQASTWPNLDDFNDAIKSLCELLVPKNFPNAVLDQINLIGFSQGAALSYAFCFYYPDRTESLAILSGFLPLTSHEYAVENDFFSRNILKKLPVFVTHGTRDDIVPVEKAREGIKLMQQVGADVLYCEDDVGHKLSLTCFSSLESFYKIKGD